MINKKINVIVQLIYIFRLLIEFINVYEICTFKVIYIFILWSNWDSCIAIIILPGNIANDLKAFGTWSRFWSIYSVFFINFKRFTKLLVVEI